MRTYERPTLTAAGSFVRLTGLVRQRQWPERSLDRRGGCSGRADTARVVVIAGAHLVGETSL